MDYRPGDSALAVLKGPGPVAEPLVPFGEAPEKPVAVTLRAKSAGELQALLDFLRPRALEVSP